jgi:hypothetical protein
VAEHPHCTRTNSNPTCSTVIVCTSPDYCEHGGNGSGAGLGANVPEPSLKMRPFERRIIMPG